MLMGRAGAASGGNPPAPPPLSKVTITVWAVVVLGIGVVIGIMLLRRYGGAGAAVELNAIRTAGTLMIVIGGAAIPAAGSAVRTTRRLTSSSRAGAGNERRE